MQFYTEVTVNNFSKSILIATSICVISITNSGCGGAEQRQEKYMQRAHEHYNSDNIHKAKIETKNVLQINPKNIEAKLLMATIHKDEGEFKRAFAIYNSIIEEMPQNIEANIELAKIYFAGKADEKSLEYVDAVLAQDPKNKESLLIVAAIDSRRGLENQAISTAKSILKDHPNDPGAVAIIASSLSQNSADEALDLVNLSLDVNKDNLMLKKLKVQLLKSTENEDALEDLLQHIAKQHPTELDYQIQLAQLYNHQNKYDHAETVLRQALSKNPKSLLAQTTLVDFFIQVKGLDTAEQEIVSLVSQNNDDFQLKNLLVRFYLDNNEVEKAKNVYLGVIDNDSQGSEAITARNQLAKIYLSQNNQSEAERYLAQIFELEPNNTEALIQRSIIHLKSNDPENAIADLRAALKNDNKSIQALRLLAMAQQQVGADQLALDAYYQILNEKPSDPQSLLNAARLNLKLGESNKAQLLLESLVKIEPRNSVAISLLMRLYGNNQNWKLAEQIVDPLLEDEKTKTSGLILQAEIERGQNQWGKAKHLYSLALKRNPGVLEAVAGYADCFLATKDYKGAETFLVSHIENNPKLDYAREMLARVYQLQESPQKAIEELESLHKQSPERISTIQKLASIYLSEQQLSPAQGLLENAILAHPEAIDLKLLLANIYEQKEKYRESINLYTSVLNTDESNFIAKNNYAVLLLNHFPNKENLTKALDLASDLAESNHPAYLDTLGWAHYKNGNIPQAISYLQTAVRRQPETEEYRYHLGMAYFKSGDLSSAKSELQLATSKLSDSYFGIEEARKTLESI